MEKDLFSAEKEFVPSGQLTWPTFVLNLAVQITTIILCVFLSRAI